MEDKTKKPLWLACLGTGAVALYTAWLCIVYRDGILYIEEPSAEVEYGPWQRVSALLAPVAIAAFAVTMILFIEGCRLHRDGKETEKDRSRFLQSVMLVCIAGLIYSLYVILKFRGWQLYIGMGLYAEGSLPINFDNCLYPVIAVESVMGLYLFYVLVQLPRPAKKFKK